MAEPVFCPECRAEYLWSAQTCTECAVALVPAAQLGGAGATADEMPPVSELVCIRAAALGWCSNLSDKLLEAGISHRIEMATDEGDGSDRRPGANLPYGVFVRPEDREAAAAVDAAHLRSQIPDLDAGDPLHGGEAEGCPACGAEVGAEADECPDCGLALISG